MVNILVGWMFESYGFPKLMLDLKLPMLTALLFSMNMNEI